MQLRKSGAGLISHTQEIIPCFLSGMYFLFFKINIKLCVEFQQPFPVPKSVTNTTLYFKSLERMNVTLSVTNYANRVRGRKETNKVFCSLTRAQPQPEP